MFYFPDPMDMTPNNPAILLSSKKVAKIFGKISKIKNPDWDLVKETITAKAQEEGWSTVQFSGKQVILIANIN